MKINRIKWMRKVAKLINVLLKFQTSIATEKKIDLTRFIDIIEVFRDEIHDWQVELEWQGAVENQMCTIDLKTYLRQNSLPF